MPSTRIKAYQQHLNTQFSTQAAALDAALDINPTGPTQPVWIERGTTTFIKTLIPYAVQVWSLNDSPFYMFAPADNARNMKARDKLTSEPEPVTDADKLAALANSLGCDGADDLDMAGLLDSTCPGICMNPECDYTTDVEPDQDAGNCELCGTNTVKSALELIGV